MLSNNKKTNGGGSDGNNLRQKKTDSLIASLSFVKVQKPLRSPPSPAELRHFLHKENKH